LFCSVLLVSFLAAKNEKLSWPLYAIHADAFPSRVSLILVIHRFGKKMPCFGNVKWKSTIPCRRIAVDWRLNLACWACRRELVCVESINGLKRRRRDLNDEL
jgi:hypothetical protein